MPSVRLVRRGWLKREFDVTLQEVLGEPHRLKYSGWGLGWEGVYLDGRLAVAEQSKFWFVPRFQFWFEDHHFEIEVRVGWWLGIKAFRLSIDGEPHYTEGWWSRNEVRSQQSDWD